MVSDAFVVGEDWISEHYFNAESTKQPFHTRLLTLRKDWDTRAKDGERTPMSRLAEVRRDVQTALAREEIDPAAYDEGVLTPIIRALGFSDARWHLQTNGAITVVSAADAPDTALAAVLRAQRVDDVSELLVKDAKTLITPMLIENGDEVHSVPRALSHLFNDENAPAFAVVIAGTWAMLAEKVRWPEGRYLAVDLQLVFDRNDTKKAGEFDRATAILSSETVLPGADGTCWWHETLEESVKHTVGVSKDLREGVRESIEIVANEVVRRRAAQGLAPLPDAAANDLARQSLRFLYRILFLLYAEASPELGVLPVGAPEYSLGYGLDRLRELVLVELGVDSRDRTHLYESLAALTRFVNGGHNAPAHSDEQNLPEGLTFNSLNADLLLSKNTRFIDEVGLGDGALQRVLQLLLLTRENQTKKGRDRGFISYADLGINQLGAVYEGLMSYTGFFAAEDLYEVAPNGDGSKGSWVVPVSRADSIAGKDFILETDPVTGERRRRRYSNGQFVFRLSGRDRQTSASYYSPEVLTKFVVSQALEELLDQDGHTTTAAEILELSVCEPALGSGAFAIEAVRQLADEYLKRRENETGEKVDPDQRPSEQQKVKASIALHQVYGVDLNATAVELAEISLWLDTMVEGLQAPWFGLRLRRGNSLIGARRAVYSENQVASKAWLEDAPTDVPVATLAEDMAEGRFSSATSGKIHHFLLPAEGWGAAVGAKEGKELAPEAFARLHAWRKGIRQKPSKQQIKQLQALAHRVEVLWQFTLRRLEIAERQVRRQVTLWNDPRPEQDTNELVSRGEIESFLKDPNGAYQRLRRVMDAWCAMWFWPLTDSLTEGATPPTLDEWIDGLTALLGRHVEVRKTGRATEGALMIGSATTWTDLELNEAIELGYASAVEIEVALATHPWLRSVENISKSNGFFHWELDFARVFAQGGFDLQVGNPPWVRPEYDEVASYSEFDTRFALDKKPSVDDVQRRKRAVLSDAKAGLLIVDDWTRVQTIRSFLSAVSDFGMLAGLRIDLYRCFMIVAWRNQRPRGVVGFIHPESHFTDPKAGRLRRSTYLRLRRHWHFLNELLLFDIGNKDAFGVHVYGAVKSEVGFWSASYLYSPHVVERSLAHNGMGVQPGLKDAAGKWDLQPHRSRISWITGETLRVWHELLESEATPVLCARMVYAVNRATFDVLQKLVVASRVRDERVEFSQGWNETNDFNEGRFLKQWGVPAAWEDVIIQGPNFHIANPHFKWPNESMKSNKDWTQVDLEALGSDSLPVTAYKPAGDRVVYSEKYTHWEGVRGVESARSFFRVAWRSMAKHQNERTLISVVIPPGSAHVHAVQSMGMVSNRTILMLGASMSSMIADLMVRTTAPSTLNRSVVNALPVVNGGPILDGMLARRYARLVCVTEEFSDLYNALPAVTGVRDSWAGGIEYEGRSELAFDEEKWSSSVVIRRASDRRQAQLEIDVLAAISLGITAEELCTIYRTQFAVLYGYDRNSYFYDANGRLVPQDVLKVWKKIGDAITQEERIAVHPGSGVAYEYELPFVTLDRETDMRKAYAHFEKILREHA